MYFSGTQSSRNKQDRPVKTCHSAYRDCYRNHLKITIKVAQRIKSYCWMPNTNLPPNWQMLASRTQPQVHYIRIRCTHRDRCCGCRHNERRSAGLCRQCIRPHQLIKWSKIDQQVRAISVYFHFDKKAKKACVQNLHFITTNLLYTFHKKVNLRDFVIYCLLTSNYK